MVTEKQVHSLNGLLQALELPVSIVNRVTALKDAGVLSQQTVTDVTNALMSYGLQMKAELLGMIAELGAE